MPAAYKNELGVLVVGPGASVLFDALQIPAGMLEFHWIPL